MEHCPSIFEKIHSGYYNNHKDDFYYDTYRIVAVCGSWYRDYLSTHLIQNYEKNVFVFTNKPQGIIRDTKIIISCMKFIQNSYVDYIKQINTKIIHNDRSKDIYRMVYWMLSSLYKHRYDTHKIQQVIDIVKDKSEAYGFNHEELCRCISHSSTLYFLHGYPHIIKRLYDFGLKYIPLCRPKVYEVEFMNIDLSNVSSIHKKLVLDLITTRTIHLKRISSEYHTIELVDHFDSIGRNIDKYKGVMYDVYKICK